jgi:preprotein translocase subunit SecG
MGILGILLLVFFVIIAVLLILLVLIQNEEGDSLGGIFAGGSGSAFGSRSGNILTRTTSVLGALFLVISLSLALVNRSPGDSGVEAAGRQSSSGANRNWWQEDASPEAAVPEAVVPESVSPEVIPTEAAVSDVIPEAAPQSAATAPAVSPVVAPPPAAVTVPAAEPAPVVMTDSGTDETVAEPEVGAPVSE